MDKLSIFSSLIATIAAAPVEASEHGNVVRYGTGGGILGFLVYEPLRSDCDLAKSQ